MCTHYEVNFSHFTVQFRYNFTDTLSAERPKLALMFTRKYNKLVVHLKVCSCKCVYSRNDSFTDDRDQSQLS